MPVTRSRTLADIRHDLETTEQRYRELYARWAADGTSAHLAAVGPAGRIADRTEELLRWQRGALDRLHALWIEYAQASGQHAPQ